MEQNTGRNDAKEDVTINAKRDEADVGAKQCEFEAENTGDIAVSKGQLRLPFVETR